MTGAWPRASCMSSGTACSGGALLPAAVRTKQSTIATFSGVGLSRSTGSTSPAMVRAPDDPAIIRSQMGDRKGRVSCLMPCRSDQRGRRLGGTMTRLGADDPISIQYIPIYISKYDHNGVLGNKCKVFLEIIFCAALGRYLSLSGVYCVGRILPHIASNMRIGLRLCL